MSILGRQVSGKVVALVAAGLVVAALLPVMTQAPAREITLIVRDMAFYLEGDPRLPNPTIDVAAGERVRVIVMNQDRGMTHDFAVPSLSEAMSPMTWNQQDDVTFTVPATPGTYEYVCRPHRLMMHGTIRVH
jgi:plastocyanin